MKAGTFDIVMLVWFVFCGLVAATIVAGGGYALWHWVTEPQVGSLDQAQHTFERSLKWPTVEDFDGWRATGALDCRDHQTLRICEAIWNRLEDGKPIGKDRVAFACSPQVCAWVDP